MIDIIHLSDFHFRKSWPEESDIVLNELFEDLRVQVSGCINPYVIFTGDMVQSGQDNEQYEGFIKSFDSKLNELGIDKSKRIIVPGNHDLCTESVRNKIIEHESIVSNILEEREFNNYISGENVFYGKFSNYLVFLEEFTGKVIQKSDFSGYGVDVCGIGFFCLNSALCSSGGVKPSGKKYLDYGRLNIDTRKIYDWVQSNDHKVRILLLHHPLEWLSDWSRKELEIICEKHFDLVLHGHEHTPKYVTHLKNGKKTVIVSAPPLFTSKNEKLGYSIIKVSSIDGPSKICYRQWTSHRRFVSGVDFSGTDDGEVEISGKPSLSVAKHTSTALLFYKSKLDSALQTFVSQPKVWIDPIIKNIPENSTSAKSDNIFILDVESIVSKPKSLLIKAPPQFGLSCVSLHMCLKAAEQGKFWLRIDCKEITANRLEKFCKEQLSQFGIEMEDLDAIIVDSVTSSEQDKKLLKIIGKNFQGKPILVMETMDSRGGIHSIDESLSDLDCYYLWSLSKDKIRKIVSHYNAEKNVGDDTAVLNRVSNDLLVLNLHRTPLNCLTLLKVFEADFDESPVNRTEMIKRILFLLFNVESIPSYKSKPDLKDCEYILGRLCEVMLIDNFSNFTRDYFINNLSKFCSERFIDLEVSIVFDVLVDNCILVKYGNNFYFRFSYWIYYFAAQRMHQSPEFRDFIYSGMRYARYPEIIEFYTGIDRRRNDALEVIINHLESSCDVVESKCGMSFDFNLYGQMKWRLSDIDAEKIMHDLNDEVKESNLPTEVKDRYSDQYYDRQKPYNQDAMQILDEYSALILMQAVRAGARALRNSDYAEPELKRKLFSAVTKAWKIMSNLILLISPVLAQHGRAKIDGAGFQLVGDFGSTVHERMNRLFVAIPSNIVDWYRHDIYSKKMAPLITEELKLCDDEIIVHKLILLTISEKPKNWRQTVESYIASVGKNSFYLYDTLSTLKHVYRYSNLSNQQLVDTKFLIKKTVAKHLHGITNPGVKAVDKIPDKVLPDREVNL